MNKNKILVFIGLLGAILLGLGIGYLLFFQASTGMEPMNSDHDHADMGSEATTWTCSMHPQIRQNEPGVCPICEMDLIPLEANTSNDPLILEMTPEAVKLAQIETTVIGSTSSAEKKLSLSGKIQADERLSASQVAHIPGRIEQLFVTFTGEQVRRGQKLATIYSPELITAQRELLEAIKFQDINADLLKAARKKLSYWKIPTEEIQAMEESGQIQETFTLLADASGVVTGRRVAVGDYLKQGEVLFDLVNLSRLWVLFDAYEEDLATIHLGDRIEFTTPAVPNKIFSTRISFIDPLIDSKTRVAYLRGEINNPGQMLKPEMFVRGHTQSSIKTDQQLVVPRSAVMWTGQRSVVYVKVPDRAIPSFTFREITLGDRMGGQVLVEAGLEAGETVVTYGNFSIDAAAQLNNQASMMNRDVLLKGADHSQHLPDFTESSPLAFKQQLAEVTAVYLQLKDAFVATDSLLAQQSAQQLVGTLDKVDMSLVKGDAHLFWMEQLEALQTHSKKIVELRDVEEQRKQFDFLSQALITTIKVFGIPDNRYYVQYCPMAFDSAGANWISDEEAIQNPFFGDKMLKCGSVEETITKDYKNRPMEQASSAPRSGHNH
jgi:Cu(I)/Ag(I) efflux system membrane fusion protein